MGGSDLYVGTLDLAILKAVSWGAMHGYAIGRWIRQTTEDVLDVDEGSLYPALHRLQRAGWLDEEWGLTETNRRAKFYTLTAAGRAHLSAQAARWARHSRAMAALLAEPSA